MARRSKSSNNTHWGYLAAHDAFIDAEGTDRKDTPGVVERTEVTNNAGGMFAKRESTIIAPGAQIGAATGANTLKADERSFISAHAANLNGGRAVSSNSGSVIDLLDANFVELNPPPNSDPEQGIIIYWVTAP